MSSSYNAGRWKEQVENQNNEPYLEYVAVLDGSTRPAHAEQNGQIHRVSSPYWDIWYPPNGYNCRCRVKGRTAKEAKGGSTKRVRGTKPDEGFKGNPGKSQKVTLKNLDKDIKNL